MVAPGSSALNDILDPLKDSLSREMAERLVALRVDGATRVRIEELATRANEGTLTETERADYLDYIEAMDLVAILQAKARAVISRSANG